MQRKRFTIPYTLTQKVVRNLKIVTEVAAVMQIEGVAYCNPNESALSGERYTVDIDFVWYKTVDIKAVLEAVGAIEAIEEHCIREAAKFFTQKEAA